MEPLSDAQLMVMDALNGCGPSCLTTNAFFNRHITDIRHIVLHTIVLKPQQILKV